MKKSTKMKKRLSGFFRAAAIPAVSAALAVTLASCSVIKINYEKFGLGTTASGTDAASDPSQTGQGTVSRYETTFTPPDKYEFTGKEKAESLLSEISFDFAGESVFIGTTDEDGLSRLLSLSDEEKNTYEASKYDRSRMVEEKLNCHIRTAASTREELIEKMKASVDSGEYFVDAFALTGEDLAVMAEAGLLLNLNSLAFFDIGAEYFHPATSGLSAGNSAYAVVSSATVDPDGISCIFYNTDVVTEDITSLVRSGEWTWDEFFRISDGSGKGISADAVAGDDGENVVDEKWMSRVIFGSAGLTFVSNERGQTPTMTLPDGAQAAADVYRTLGDRSLLAGVNNFASGESAFHIGTLSNMEALANIDAVWDVAPMPKLSASQENYRSAMPESSLFLAAPVNTTNPDGVSAFLRAISASSYSYLRDSYIEYHMYNTVRLESTLGMLEIIYDSADYDIADVFGRANDGIYAASAGLLLDVANDAEADIGSLFEKRRGDADAELAKLFGVPDQG